MSRKISLIAIAAACLALASVPAFAAKGGNGGGKGGNAGATGGSTGGGQVDPSIGISSQSPGSISFSVNTDGTAVVLYVDSFCYDANAMLAWSADQAVVMSSSTLGFAGPFSPPSGYSCVAYVHTAGSTTRLAQLSYTAP